MLLQLGARKRGLHIHPLGCTAGLGTPQPFPQVVGTLEVLEPISSGSAAGASGPHVEARWQSVDVRLSRSTLDNAGQCELLEQVRNRIVPLFATRAVRFQTNCLPHQLTVPGAVLRLEVLKPAHASGPAHRGRATAQ